MTELEALVFIGEQLNWIGILMTGMVIIMATIALLTAVK